MDKSKYLHANTTLDNHLNNAIQMPDELAEKLIGRDDESALLLDHLHNAEQGHGNFLIINGEQGVGKNFFVRTILDTAQLNGFSTREINFRDYSPMDPYHPFIEIITQKTENQQSESAAESTDTSDSFDRLQNQHTILQQKIMTELIKISKQQPLVLFFQNIYHASHTAIQFLHYLGGKILDQKILFITTLSTETDQSSKFKKPVYDDILQRMNREGLIEKIQLNRVDSKEIRGYLNKRYRKSDFNRNFPEFLNKVSSGLSVSLAAAIDYLEAENLIFLQDDIWSNSENLDARQIQDQLIKQSSLEQIENDLKQLDEKKMKILEISALLEERYEFPLMSAITEYSRINLLRDLAFLVDKKYLLSLNETSFVIINTATRLAILKQMDAEHKVEIHNAIIAGIQKYEGMEESREIYLLAKHYMASGDNELALKHLLIAGKFSLRNLAFNESKSFYEDALNIINGQPAEQEQETLADVYLKLIWINRILGLWEESLEKIKLAESLVSKANQEVFAHFLLQKGLTYFRVRNWQEAESCLKECLKNDSALTSLDKISVYYGLASVLFELSRYDESKENFDLALVEAQRMGDKISEARILNNLGAVDSVTGRGMKAIAHYSRSIPLYESIKDQYGLAQIYNNIGLTYAEEGKWNEANKNYGKSLGYCDQIGVIPLKLIVFLNRAFALSQLDDLDTAMEYNTKALHLLNRTNDHLNMAEYHKNLGVIRRKENQLKQAETSLSLALELFDKYGNRLGYAETAFELGVLELDQSNFAEADKWFEKAIECYNEIGLSRRANAVANEQRILTPNSAAVTAAV